RARARERGRGGAGVAPTRRRPSTVRGFAQARRRADVVSAPASFAHIREVKRKFSARILHRDFLLTLSRASRYVPSHAAPLAPGMERPLSRRSFPPACEVIAWRPARGGRRSARF